MSEFGGLRKHKKSQHALNNRWVDALHHVFVTVLILLLLLWRTWRTLIGAIPMVTMAQSTAKSVKCVSECVRSLWVCVLRQFAELWAMVTMGIEPITVNNNNNNIPSTRLMRVLFTRCIRTTNQPWFVPCSTSVPPTNHDLFLVLHPYHQPTMICSLFCIRTTNHPWFCSCAHIFLTHLCYFTPVLH